MRSPAGALICLLLVGCASIIPDKVQPIEYEIYNQWITQRFQKEPPKALYLSRFTSPFSQGSSSCRETMIKDGVSRVMIRALETLGAARFPLQSETSKIQIPYEYEYSSLVDAKAQNFKYIELSRVAFNRSQTQGLFTFNVSTCIDGYCGGGGSAVLASKIDGKWQLKPVGCVVTQ